MTGEARDDNRLSLWSVVVKILMNVADRMGE